MTRREALRSARQRIRHAGTGTRLARARGSRGFAGAGRPISPRPRSTSFILFLNGGPVARRYLRSQADAHQVRRQGHPGGSWHGKKDSTRASEAVVLAVPLREIRPKRARGERSVSSRRQAIDDVLRAALDVHAICPRIRRRSCRRTRGASFRPSVDGLVVDLRPGNRESESAGLHRDLSRHAERRAAAVEFGIPAFEVSRHLRALR